MMPEPCAQAFIKRAFHDGGKPAKIRIKPARPTTSREGEGKSDHDQPDHDHAAQPFGKLLIHHNRRLSDAAEFGFVAGKRDLRADVHGGSPKEKTALPKHT
jgi:hypothetical protein